MSFDGKNPFKIMRQTRLPGGFDTEVIGTTRVLTYQDSQFLRLDPGTGGINVNMPAEGSRAGAYFWIVNGGSSGTPILYVNQANGSTTIVNVDQNEAALIYATGDGEAGGSSGWTLFANFTIALS